MSDTTDETLPRSTRIIYAVFDWVRGHRMFLLVSLVAVAVLAGLSNAVYVVKKEEQAVVTRFGKVVETDVQPGLHVRIPVADRAHIRKVARVIRSNVATEDADGNVNFSILSGDTNLFEVDVALQYRIGNLEKYLFTTVDPHSVLVLMVRERLVGIMGNSFIDLIFTNNRDIIQARLFDEVREMIDDSGIGIELLALNIVDLRPIDETVAAFRDVSDAIAESIEMISDANKLTEQLLARSRGQAEGVVINARARARERRLQSASSAQVFLDLLSTYRSEPSSVSITRYWQRVRDAFREATLATVNPGDPSVIDINMIENFVPGVGSVPSVAMAGTVAAGSSAAPETTLTIGSERGAHGLETVRTDRHLMEGRFHFPGSERHHLSAAEMRSLIFDDLSIFSHRHLAPTPVVSAVEKNEPPMVEKTVIDTSKDVQSGLEAPLDTQAETPKKEPALAEKAADDESH